MPNPRSRRRNHQAGGWSRARQREAVNPLPADAHGRPGRLLWISLGLIVANVLVYWAVLRYGFVDFGDQYVYETRRVADGLTWEGVVWAFTTGDQYSWHPLTWLSHMLDVQLYGMQADRHHLTNLLLHIVNTLLLFKVLHRMTGAVGSSGFVAALFAVHPLHVEPVAWLAGRKDVLGALFMMLTLGSYVSYVRRPRRTRYVLVLVWLALALLANPILATLPFVLLLLDYWPLGRMRLADAATPPREVRRRPEDRAVWVRLLREKAPMFAVAITAILVTVLVAQRGGAAVGLTHVSRVLLAGNALVSYVTYVGKMLWPARLAAFYPYTSLLSWQVAGSALILVAAFSVALWSVRRHPYVLMGWLWYVGTLLPVIGLVQVGNQRMADRYTYVPLIGLFLIVAWGVPDLLGGWRRRQIVLPVAAAIVLTACATTARRQVRTWESRVTLWQHAAAVTRDNFLAHSNLGELAANQEKLDEAIAHFAEVVRIRPRSANARFILGNALNRSGRIEEAVAQYTEAVRITPQFAEAHYSLGLALKAQGKASEATPHFAEVARLKPFFAEGRYNFGLALAEQKRFDEAIPEMLEAVRLKPNQAAWHFDLAGCYYGKGDTEHAKQHLERTLKLDPLHFAARRLLNNLTRRERQ